MSNTEKVEIEGVEFRVFRRLPVPIARAVQNLLVEAAAESAASIEELESGTVKREDANKMKLSCIFDAHDLLLTRAVLSPPILQTDINDINNDLQCCFQELAEYLMAKFDTEKKNVKKKSPNSPN